MKSGKISQLFQYVRKSKFIRSIFLETVAIFLAVILVVVAIIFFSFSSQINANIVSDQKSQLDTLESAISSRMEEVTSIAYNIGQDSMFYIRPVDGVKYSGYEMSTALSRYLIGNRFIEHIAFYRLSEPDTIYTSNGQLSFHRFWASYLACDNFTEESFLEGIRTQNGVQLHRLTNKQDVTWFAYVCPLPQFSVQPLAFVIALIPFDEIAEPLCAQLMNEAGTAAVFDAKGDVIYRVSTFDGNVALTPPESGTNHTQYNITDGGQTYVVQSKTSVTNGWSYVSAVRLNSVFAELAGTQVCVLAALILLMNRGVHNQLVDCDEATGKVRLTEATDAYRDFLEYFNRLYSEGLIDSNIFAITKEEWTSNTANDRIGIYANTNLASMPAGLDANWIGIEEALEGPNGDKLWTAIRANFHSTGNAIIPATCSDPALVLRWLDYFWTDEGTLFYHMGVEGETFVTKDDGTFDYTPSIYQEIADMGLPFDEVVAKYSPYPGGGNPTVEIAPYFMGGEMAPVPAATARALFPYGPGEYWPSFTFTAEETEALNALTTDINKYCTEMRISFVTGTASLDEWPTYKAQLDKFQTDELLAIYQKALDRYHAMAH